MIINSIVLSLRYVLFKAQMINSGDFSYPIEFALSIEQRIVLSQYIFEKKTFLLTNFYFYFIIFKIIARLFQPVI